MAILSVLQRLPITIVAERPESRSDASSVDRLRATHSERVAQRFLVIWRNASDSR